MMQDRPQKRPNRRETREQVAGMFHLLNEDQRAKSAALLTRYHALYVAPIEHRVAVLEWQRLPWWRRVGPWRVPKPVLAPYIEEAPAAEPPPSRIVTP